MEIKITINDKLINFLKKVFAKKNGIFIIAAVLFCGGLLIFSQQVDLDTFHDGDIIYAGPINDNFRSLRDRELGSLADVDTSGAGDGQVLKYNGTSWAPGTDNTGGLGVWTESGNDIYWNGTGNVGIGTTGPSYKLDVIGDIRATGSVYYTVVQTAAQTEQLIQNLISYLKMIIR